jgi:tol-pal system protein YbgF
MQAQADMQLRLQQLEREIRELNGKVEEQSYALRQLQSAFEKANSDVTMRLNDLEGGKPSGGGSFEVDTGASVKPASPAPKKAEKVLGTMPANGSAAVDSGDATSVYESAYALLRQEKYDAAQKAFEGFLTKYKSHALAGNAKYWLGETHYVRGDYDKAARIFAEGYQQYPKGTKAPDNLLKLGMALGQMGQTDDACIALRQVSKDYPSGAGQVVRRADQEIERLKCP